MVIPACCAAAAAAGPAAADEGQIDPANSCLECAATGIVPCECPAPWPPKQRQVTMHVRIEPGWITLHVITCCS